ncbi:hypothetical protein [Actinomycetospora lemnae]|uniref:Uncharacterized protein n=1 Tax=Actinomycetospora lemnae TaxID=3019891 RepID=A0ABT5SSR6_9PSEU|nr:hypothetical protein [Actinomycetospora sp. DW7H6]MDD7965894.1 hypothetical protein [Actinomycetospora sp. DW7H6]
MLVAYHFDEDETPRRPYTPPLRVIEASCVLAIVEAVPAYRRHVTIRSGIPAVDRLRVEEHVAYALAEDLLNGASAWKTLSDDPHPYLIQLTDRRVSVELIDGLSLDDAIRVDELLKEDSGYLGALQVRQELPRPWVFYAAALPLSYRIHRNSVSLLYSADQDPEVAGEDNRDHAWLAELRDYLCSEPQISIGFGSSGYQDLSIIDKRSLEYAQKTARVDRVLGSLLSGVVADIYLRARMIDPDLIEVYDAALIAMEQHTGPEQLAQVALSCRRLLERLADALYPARPETVDGRNVSEDKYRNRLWAYIEEQMTSSTESAILLANLVDVGTRVNSLDAASNKGLHAKVVGSSEIHRLLVNLTVLVFDLMGLKKVDAKPAPSYDAEIAAEIGRLIRGDRDH